MNPFVSEDRNLTIDFDKGIVSVREREEILEVRLTKLDLDNLYYSVVDYSLLEDTV